MTSLEPVCLNLNTAVYELYDLVLTFSVPQLLHPQNGD